MKSPTPATVHLVSETQVMDEGEVARAGVSPTPLTPGRFRLSQVHVENVWVMSDLGNGWVVAYRLVAQGSNFVIGEVRVYPLETQAMLNLKTGRTRASPVDAAWWSGNVKGVRASVPPGGISSRILKRVTVGAHITDAREVFKQLDARARTKGRASSVLEAIASRYGVTDLRRPQRIGSSESGPRGLPRSVYVRTAQAYLAHLKGGRPVQDAARELGETPQKVRDRILRARRMGILDPAPSRGRAAAGLSAGSLVAPKTTHKEKRHGKTTRAR